MVEINGYTGFPDYNINGMVPFDSEASDILGCVWFSEGEIAGWDSPDVRVTMLTRIGSDPSADGEIPGDLHYRGRELVFSLYAVCPDEPTQERAMYEITQATDLIDGSGIFYANEVIPKQAVIVRGNNMGRGNLVLTRVGTPTFSAGNQAVMTAAGLDPSKVFVFKADLQLYCPDPRKYAQSITTASLVGGAATITNQGNTGTQNIVITLTATGGGSGPIAINVGGRVMNIVVPNLPSGAPALNPIPTKLVIDVGAKTITDGSGTNYYYLRDLTTPWPVLLPGASAVLASGQAGTIAIRSAWI